MGRVSPAFKSIRIAAALVALVALSVPASARQMLRGYPLGEVLEVNRRAGIVSVDMGARDGIMKGMSFSVVDRSGNEAALVVTDEVYDDMFWSGPVDAGRLAGIERGMQVRWALTAETTALVAARKKDTAGAYREFIAAFPASLFIPQLVRQLPDDTLMAVAPDFYDAWKLYTSYGFREYEDAHPGTGLAAAAAAEAKSIEEYEAGREQEKKQRAERAKAYQEEQGRKEALTEQMRQRERMREAESVRGKIVNASGQAVRFVFDPPCMLGTMVMDANSERDASHPSGLYTYKVFAMPEAQEFPSMTVDDEPVEETPLAEGTADMQFDFWTLQYP